METMYALGGFEGSQASEPKGFQGPPVFDEESITEPLLFSTGVQSTKSVPNELCPMHKFPACPIPSYILKMPSRKESEPEVEASPSASHSAVSLEFLRSLLRRIPGGVSGGATMAQVVEELIRPATSATLSSYASQPFLVPRSHVSAPTWVVIHPWDLPLAHLITTLEDFSADLPPGRTFFWLRALAVSQHIMGASAALQPLADLRTDGELPPATVIPPRSPRAPSPPSPRSPAGVSGGTNGETSGGGDFRVVASVASFGTMLQKRQLGLVFRQRAAVREARLTAIAATRGALAASRCGALLVVGRDVRPLRGAWCLLEVAEALRSRGPEAVTVLPVDKSFTRADLVRQLRDLDVAEAVAEAEEYDREVLAEWLGVLPPLSPRAAATAAVLAAAGGTATTAMASTATTASATSGTATDGTVRRRPSVPDHLRSNRDDGSCSGSGSGGPAALDPGVNDGFSGGRALTRQLQLALLMRPMDGALPARMLGITMGDADPVALNPSANNTSAGPTAFATPLAAATAAAAVITPRVPFGGPRVFPCAFDWLWNWTPLTSWLTLPRDHPHWQTLLVTGTHGAGKTTAMAALLARLAAANTATSVTRGSLAEAPLIACHFCSAADARSLVASEVVRSLSYQLSCRSPGFGSALCRSLLQVGGPGGGLALVPDGWLQGPEEVVAALLRRPMEADIEGRAARGNLPPSYIFLLDGLDEGPASAASTAVLGDYPPSPSLSPSLGSTVGGAVAIAGQSGADTGPASCPGPYQVLRLIVDHLRNLPNVRLVLSCTEAAAEAGGAADGMVAAAMAAARRQPYKQPPPLVVAPKVAADASTSVHLAVRQSLRPRELSLASFRRDKHLPLALSHSLQEYVLSPEMTARELLWQARGCLAHVHILQLLVRHAAEQLGPADGLPDGAVIAAAASAANAANAPPTAVEAHQPLDTGAPAPDLQVEAEEGAAENVAPPPPAALAAGAAAPHQVQDLPPRPCTPPRQDQAGVLRELTSRRQGGSGPVEGLGTASASAPPPQPPDYASTFPVKPPPELLALGAPATGEGNLGVHIIPPVSRGNLEDEYGVLWHVRTAELREAAMLAAARDTEASTAAAVMAVEEESAPSSPAQSPRPRHPPRRVDTLMLGLTTSAPLPPPHPSQRAARLQLLVDVMAAAQEPMDWHLLARVVLAAEAEAQAALAATAVMPTTVRSTRSEIRSPSPSMGGRGVASGATSQQGATPMSLRSGISGGRGAPIGDSKDGTEDGSTRMLLPAVGASKQMQPQLSREASAVATAAALRDLEWALQEGPLAGLVWISGCGKITVRHSSFLDWLRRSGVTVAVAATAQGPPVTATAAALAAAATGVAGGSGGVAITHSSSSALMSVPRAQHGHAALARVLRQQLLSGRMALATPPSPLTPLPPPAVVGLNRRPGSASIVPRVSMDLAAAAGAAVMGQALQAQASSGLGFQLGFVSSGGSGGWQALGPPASAYCLRHLVTHCAEGRLLASELESTVLDLDFWRQVLESGHLEMVAASLEHLLRTRGPHVQGVVPQKQGQQSQVGQQRQQGQQPPGLQPRTPPLAGAATVLVRSGLTHISGPSAAMSSGGGTTVATTGAKIGTIAHIISVTNVSSSVSAAGGGAEGGVEVGGTAAVDAEAAVRILDGRLSAALPPLPASTCSLLRDTLLWLLQDGYTLSRRPEPLMIACSASCTPLQSPFRRLAEQTTATAVVAAAAAAADALIWPPPNKSAPWLLSSATNSRAQSPLPPGSPPIPPPPGSAAAAAAAAAAATPEPLFPPCLVTALPHPRFRCSVLRTAECPHRVTALLCSPRGDLVLASGEFAMKASLIDTLSGRHATMLHARRSAHPTTLSAGAFALSRPLLATAGSSPGTVTLWDLTTGAPRATMHLRSDLDGATDVSSDEGDGSGHTDVSPNLGVTTGSDTNQTEAIAEPSFAPLMTDDCAKAALEVATTDPVGAQQQQPDAAEAVAAIKGESATSAATSFQSESQLDQVVRSVAISAVHSVSLVQAEAEPSLRDGGLAAAAGEPESGHFSIRDTHGSLHPPPPPPVDNSASWASCIAIYEPGPAANATAYGAPPGTPVVLSSIDTAAAAGAAIVRGSILVAAGDSNSGQVVLWAVAPDGWGAQRTADLVPPAVVGSGGGSAGSGVAWLGFLPGGKTLLVVQSCSTLLRVWNVQSHNITANLRLPAACGEVLAVHIAPQLKYDTVTARATGASTSDTVLAVVCTSRTELWDLDRRQHLATLPISARGQGGGRAWADACIAFSPAGGLLASTGALCSQSASLSNRGANTARNSTPFAVAAPAATTAVGISPLPPPPPPQQPQPLGLVYDPCAATLWDARTGAEVLQLRGLQRPVQALAFSPDGALLATAMAEAAVVLWSAATGNRLATLPLDAEVMDVPSVVFARRGAVLMAAGGSAVFSWDVQLAVAAAAADAAIYGSGVSSISGTAGPHFLRDSMPGTAIGGGSISSIVSGAAGAAGNVGMRRSLTTMTQSSGHRDKVSALCFSPNGLLVLTGGEDSSLRMWDMMRHSELLAVEQPGAVLSLAWSPDGLLVAGGLSNGTAHVWHFAEDAHLSAIVAAAQGDFTVREAARLRCGDGSAPGSTTTDDTGGVSTTMDRVSFSANGKLLLTANGEGRVSIWSVRDWQLDSTAVPCVRPSRASVARVTGEGIAPSVFGSGTLVGRFAGAAFTADGKWVLMGCGREVMMWSVKAKREASDRLGPHGAPVVAVAASPCGKLAAVGAGSTVTIWGPPAVGGRRTVGVGRSGGAAAAGGGSVVSFRGQAGGAGVTTSGVGTVSPFSTRVTLLPGLAEITALAFGAEGGVLAASLGDGSVRVWETARWKEVAWLSAHGSTASCVAFSPDSRVLLSGGADCRCLAWSTRDVLQQPTFTSNDDE